MTATKRSVMKPVSWLIEDTALYPRTKIDDANVASLVEAIRAGAEDEIPPIVAEASTGRIIDGFHRRRAWIRVQGAEAVVPVLLVDYASEAEAFSDAVRRNSSHGRKLNSNDEIRSAIVLRGLGVTDDNIAIVLRIPPVKVQKLTVQVAISPAGDPVPLKQGDRHLKGRQLTPPAVEALSHRSGDSYTRLARQILDGLQNDLLPEDDATWQVLAELQDALQTALNSREGSPLAI